MTYAEILGINVLKKFVEKAKDEGLCYKNSDMDFDTQATVIQIVSDYIEGAEENGDL